MQMGEIGIREKRLGLHDQSEDPQDCVKPSKKFKAKGAIKMKCTEDLENDLLDITGNNEHFKRKLIFTNTKTATNAEYYERIIKEMSARCQERGETFKFTLDQTRNKFKMLMSVCKNALLTVKTASGIERFQNEKEYGKWFDVLLPLMKTRLSCQPDQAIEPSVGANYLPEDSVSEVPHHRLGFIQLPHQ